MDSAFSKDNATRKGILAVRVVGSLLSRLSCTQKTKGLLMRGASNPINLKASLSKFIQMKHEMKENTPKEYYLVK